MNYSRLRFKKAKPDYLQLVFRFFIFRFKISNIAFWQKVLKHSAGGSEVFFIIKINKISFVKFYA
jgi:hypothetical protein